MVSVCAGAGRVFSSAKTTARANWRRTVFIRPVKLAERLHGGRHFGQARLQAERVVDVGAPGLNGAQVSGDWVDILIVANRASHRALHEESRMNVSIVDSMKSIVQEAMETASQTKAEAAKGDKQAIRKLAQEQAAANTQGEQPSAASEEGKLDFKV